MEDTERYITALLNGDDSVIKEIYSKMFPKIVSYIQKNSGKKDDALDVFHDALMYIIVTQKEKRTVIFSFEAYLFVVCKNIWKKTLKNRVIKADVVALEDKETNLSAFILKQQCFDFYVAKFELLSENCKDLLVSYFNGSTYEDLLIEFSYATVNTVRQRIFKCRTKLTELIKSDKEFKRIIKWGEF